MLRSLTGLTGFTGLDRALIISRRKSGLLWSLFIWAGTVWITFINAISVLPAIARKHPDAVHARAIQWGCTLARFTRTRIHVRNADRLFRNGPVILLSNHQSLFDVPVLYTFIDVPFRWMAKSSLFRIPLVGLAMRAADYIPVERGDSRKSLQSLFDAAELIQKGKSVIVFPEGTRGEADGTMLPFKKGAFLLARKAAVTLQPVVIWGNQDVMPRERDRWLQRFYSGDVYVEVLDPIPPEEFRDMKAEEVAAMVRQRMEHAMDRLKTWELDATMPSDADPRAKPAIEPPAAT